MYVILSLSVCGYMYVCMYVCMYDCMLCIYKEIIFDR